MAKLYFRYGAMGSGKTRDILKVWYNYHEKDKEAIIIKRDIDTKGDNKVVSRDSSEREVDYLISEDDNIYEIIARHIINYNLDCVLVDEAQFLTKEQVMQLTDVVDMLDIPVICYGLRGDFQDTFFPGSAALFLEADKTEEMVTVCDCGEAATRNVRFENGIPVFDGDQIAIDGVKVTYRSMCRMCRKKLLKKMNRLDK